MGKKGMGWVPDYPDVRDCTLSHEKVKRIQSSLSGSSLDEGFDDRDQQLLKLVTILEKAVPNFNIIPNLPELNQLKEKFQRDADQKLQEFDQKLHFVSANFTEGFLSLGSEGKEVQDLQDKLCKLEYLKCEKGKKEFTHSPLASDAPGYFGEATKAAVKDFQVNQQLKDTNGIYTPLTRAELLAWVSITGKLGQSTYGLRVSGPSVIYIHALLKRADQIVNQNNPDKPLDLFSDIALKAVQELQTNSNKSHPDKCISENGVVDQATWNLLLENEDKDLRKECPTPPVPKKKFIDLKEKICKVIEAKTSYERENNAGETESSLVQVDVSRLRSLLELEPIIEVLIQLAPCVDKGMSFETAIETGFNWLLSMIPLTDESDDRLTLLAQRLERGKGYVSSKIFRYASYERGMSGPAVTYIQERLRAMGYYNAPTTGYFDELTQEAVKRFQAESLQKEPSGSFGQDEMKHLHLEENPEEETSQEVLVIFGMPLPPTLIEDLLNNRISEFPEEIAQEIESIIAREKELEDEAKKANQASNLNASQLIEALKLHLSELDLDLYSQDAFKGISQNSNSLTQQTIEQKQELARQFVMLMAAFIVRPIANVIAQLIMPIGKYSSAEAAFKDGFNRFKVIASYSKIREIDRISKGFYSITSKEIDTLMDACEPLVETLAVLQAESKQYGRSPEGNGLIEQLEALVKDAINALDRQVDVIKALDKPKQAQILMSYGTVKPIVEAIEVAVKNSLQLPQKIQSIVEANKAAVKNSPQLPQTETQITPKRDQTFIRLAPNCNGCSLQVPVTGKMYRDLTPPSTKGSLYLMLPDAVDLSVWCSDVEDQGELDACTAHAGVALLEYFEKKSFGNALDASSRFLYKVTRNLMHREGDTGASVRETMKAMVLFGVPPEEYCPYDEAKFDDDPSAFCYAFAQNYQTITYFRLDGAGMPARELLAQIKTILVGGFPCMFGFTVYDSIHDKTNPPGHIPYPTLDDKQEGGHAAIAVGYNDYKQIKNATNPGAFLIKNSWGVDWGEGGYGWLPYDYVLNGLARDWWSLIKSEWIESKQFGLSAPDLWLANLGSDRDDRGTVC